MPSPWPVLQSLADHASAVAALPASGPLPVRTAIVGSERQAHALRRELIRSGRGAILGGTRFVGTAALAREILEDAGASFTPGEESLRAPRLLALIEEDLPLEYFELDLLRSTPGWPEAFAAAISDLEGAGLEPSRLPATTAAWRDVALLWSRVEKAAGRSWTSARIYREAVVRLASGANPSTGPIFAAVTGRESAAQARFLLALPGITLGVVAARPLRPRHLDRLEALFGRDARAALEGAPLPAVRPHRARPPRPTPLRLARAPRRPFPAAQQGSGRHRLPRGVRRRGGRGGGRGRMGGPGSPGAEHPARGGGRPRPRWRTRSRRSSRAASSGSPGRAGGSPSTSRGAFPLTATTGGARALSLVRALRGFLSAEGLATVLPFLRAPVDDRQHVTTGEAMGIAWGVGTAGGNQARKEGALEWPERLSTREAQVSAALEALGPEKEERDGWGLRDEFDLLRAVKPAVSALCALARLVVDDRPLADLSPAFLDFLEKWVLDPGAGAPVHSLLGDELEGAGADEVARSVNGADALAVIEERIASVRLPTVRFGKPAVYVGTLSGAAGLEFEAVRILGLAEGALPSAVREDAVLPDRMRKEAGPLVPLSSDRVSAQLHSFDRAVRSARSRIALSVPHSDLERSDRETSSLLIEVGAALGRPDGKERPVIPNLQSLRRTSFEPARTSGDAFRAAHPVTEVQWLDRATVTNEIPPSWKEGRQLALSRIFALRDREGLDAADGILGEEGPFPVLPGMAPERPISASALEALLGCPLRFLFDRVLKWKDPAGPSSVRELDALTYGSLLHGVAERFYGEHGADFVARKGTLAAWRKKARAIAAEEFDTLRVSQPLVGLGVEEKERNRLYRDLDSFLGYDWGLKLDRFVGVELAFDGLTIDAGGGKLHVRGYIDRIDVAGGHGLVRDLKSGKDHPRVGKEEDPTPTRDVQLGLYSLVARKMAKEWKLPAKLHAAYVYPRNADEREFRDDHAELEQATKEWLSIAHGLLAEHSFPPSPSKDDCKYCSFRAVCDGQARSLAAVEDAEDAVAEFFSLKVDPKEGNGK